MSLGFVHACGLGGSVRGAGCPVEINHLMASLHDSKARQSLGVISSARLCFRNFSYFWLPALCCQEKGTDLPASAFSTEHRRMRLLHSSGIFPLSPPFFPSTFPSTSFCSVHQFRPLVFRCFTSSLQFRRGAYLLSGGLWIQGMMVSSGVFRLGQDHAGRPSPFTFSIFHFLIPRFRVGHGKCIHNSLNNQTGTKCFNKASKPYVLKQFNTKFSLSGNQLPRLILPPAYFSGSNLFRYNMLLRAKLQN